MALTLARQPCSGCEQPTGHLCAYCGRPVCWGCWSAGHDCQTPAPVTETPEAVVTRHMKVELDGQLDRLSQMSDEQRQAVLGYVWRDVPPEVRETALDLFS